MIERERIVDDLFAQVVELEESERQAFLAEASAKHKPLVSEGIINEVAELLRDYQSAEQDGFLKQPLVSAETDEPAHTLADGQEFEGYRILKLIDEGGMGEVYLAQDVELNRKVAIKLIKSNRKTKELLRRFRNERQILANLQHPNIAKLFQAGASRDGLPYFVMEYVEGKPIAKDADAKNLSITERLKLFRTVCSAVSYAHQNLVVHRDIKPSNILVTKDGEPKLLDFGIAKLLHESEQPDATATLLRVMTPEYASPEQVRGEPITTATDVYSLGVLLYELLTGHRPYRLKRRTADEMTKAICEQEPLKPSSLIAEVASRSANPGDKSKSAIHNRKLLRGDLDNIVLKALRKEPSSRYASVEQFSEDIRHHLEGSPVSARKGTLAYRATKFVKRNKITVAVAALVLVTLLGGIIATTVQRNRAERERLRAEKDEYANRQLLYAAQMSLAYQAWETANVGRALDLLEAQRPKPGEEDLRGFEWYLLWRLTHETSRTLLGALGKVYSIAFSPDGSKVAAVSDDGKARVWDVTTGQLLRSFGTQASGVSSIAFSPDGKYLAGSCGNGSALIWEAETGQLVRTIVGHTGGIWSVAFAPDGRTLAAASSDYTVKLWRLDTGAEAATFKGHTDRIESFVFSPDGRTLATGSDDHTAKLWDVASGKEVATLRGHSWYVTGVAFAPDGKTLATTGSDGEIKLWDVASRQAAGTIHGDGTTQNRLRFSPDGKTLAVTRADTTLRIYEVATRKLRDVLRGHTDFVFDLAFSPDGKTLASSSFDRTVRLWDLKQQPGALTLDGHTDWVSSIAFSPDGRTLASASKDATVKLWDVASGRETMTLRHLQWVNSVTFSPDGTKLATVSDAKLVRLWNPATGENLLTLSGHTAIAECGAFSPDGKVLASGGKNGEIKLWDAATGKELAALHSQYQNLIWSLAFSPDGKYLAGAEGGMRALGIPTGHLVTVWDVSSGQIVMTAQDHANDVHTVAFSPDGTLLASGSYDGTIKFWDARTWKGTATLKGQGVVSLAFSPDGKRLASVGNKTVKLWDVATRQELCTLTVPSEINSVAFSPDNKVLAAATNDGKVRLWFAATADEARRG